jgi:hypothetical protein
MTTQTNLDLTDKQPTALMRLERIVRDLRQSDPKAFGEGFNTALGAVLAEIELMKPSELADLIKSFCEGGIETESAETWSKKWKQSDQP